METEMSSVQPRSSAVSEETFKIYFVIEGMKYYSFYEIPDEQTPPPFLVPIATPPPFLVPVAKDDGDDDRDDDDDEDDEDEEEDGGEEDDDESWRAPKFLIPDIQRDMHDLTSAVCVALGSTMYLIGGSLEGRSNDEVWYTNTRDPMEGWTQGKPMKNARTGHFCFSANNKICVVGGFAHRDASKELPIEVYSPEDDSWETKSRGGPLDFIDSALFAGGKQVLLLAHDLQLLVYYVDHGTIAPSPRPNPKERDAFRIAAITVLGKTLYTASYTNKRRKFQLVGYDFLNFSEGGCLPVKVTGLNKLMADRSDYLLPEKVYEIGDCPVLGRSRVKLLAIGKNKLAVVWAVGTCYHSYVNCLKMEIDREDVGPNQMKLNAHSGSFSSHIVEAIGITQFILVNLGRKVREQVDASNERQASNCSEDSKVRKQVEASKECQASNGSEDRTSPNRSNKTCTDSIVMTSAEGKGSLGHLQKVGQQQTRPKPTTAQVASIGLRDRFPMARTLQQIMDRMMIDDPLASYNNSFAAKDNSGRTPWGIKERDNDYVLRFDMPGMNKTDVKVWVEENMLVFKAEKVQHLKDSDKEEEDWPAKSFGRYSHRISLPDNIEFDKIKAEVKDGVLYVTIPKASSTTKILNIDVQ